MSVHSAYVSTLYLCQYTLPMSEHSAYVSTLCLCQYNLPMSVQSTYVSTLRIIREQQQLTPGILYLRSICRLKHGRLGAD